MEASKEIWDLLKRIRQNLQCSICLQVLQNPVTTNCGHKFCSFCILKYLDTSRNGQCPLCKMVVSKRPLQTNTEMSMIIHCLRRLIDALEEDTGETFSSGSETKKPRSVEISGSPAHSQESSSKRKAVNTTGDLKSRAGKELSARGEGVPVESTILPSTSSLESGITHGASINQNSNSEPRSKRSLFKFLGKGFFSHQDAPSGSKLNETNVSDVESMEKDRNSDDDGTVTVGLEEEREETGFGTAVGKRDEALKSSTPIKETLVAESKEENFILIDLTDFSSKLDVVDGTPRMTPESGTKNKDESEQFGQNQEIVVATNVDGKPTSKSVSPVPVPSIPSIQKRSTRPVLWTYSKKMRLASKEQVECEVNSPVEVTENSLPRATCSTVTGGYDTGKSKGIPGEQESNEMEYVCGDGASLDFGAGYRKKLIFKRRNLSLGKTPKQVSYSSSDARVSQSENTPIRKEANAQSVEALMEQKVNDPVGTNAVLAIDTCLADVHDDSETIEKNCDVVIPESPVPDTVVELGDVLNNDYCGTDSQGMSNQSQDKTICSTHTVERNDDKEFEEGETAHSESSNRLDNELDGIDPLFKSLIKSSSKPTVPSSVNEETLDPAADQSVSVDNCGHNLEDDYEEDKQKIADALFATINESSSDSHSMDLLLNLDNISNDAVDSHRFDCSPRLSNISGAGITHNGSNSPALMASESESESDAEVRPPPKTLRSRRIFSDSEDDKDEGTENVSVGRIRVSSSSSSSSSLADVDFLLNRSSSQSQILSTQQGKALETEVAELQQKVAMYEAALNNGGPPLEVSQDSSNVKEREEEKMEVNSDEDLFNAFPSPLKKPVTLKSPVATRPPAPPKSSGKKFRKRKSIFDSLKTKQNTISTMNGNDASDRVICIDDDEEPTLPQQLKTCVITVCELNNEEVEKVRRLANSLPNIRLETEVTSDTTHVVIKTVKGMTDSVLCERSMEYFRALARKLWIVSISWVEESLMAQRLVSESTFEVMGDSAIGEATFAPFNARLSTDKLFHDICFVCVGDINRMYRTKLEELLTLNGGSVVDDLTLLSSSTCHKLIIVHCCNASLKPLESAIFKAAYVTSGVIAVKKDWIVDCLSHQYLLTTSDYCLNYTSSASRFEATHSKWSL